MWKWFRNDGDAISNFTSAFSTARARAGEAGADILARCLFWLQPKEAARRAWERTIGTPFPDWVDPWSVALGSVVGAAGLLLALSMLPEAPEGEGWQMLDKHRDPLHGEMHWRRNNRREEPWQWERPTDWYQERADAAEAGQGVPWRSNGGPEPRSRLYPVAEEDAPRSEAEREWNPPVAGSEVR